MSLTTTGPALLLVLLYIFITAPQKLTYCVIFFAPFSATAILNLTALGYKSGGVGLTPAMMSMLLIFAAQVFYGFSSRPVTVSSGHLVQIGFISLFIGLVLVSLVANGASNGITSYQITQTTYLLIGLIGTIVLSLEFCRSDGIETVVSASRAACTFSCVWGFVQLACFFTGIPYPSILFNNSLSDSADMFDQDLGGSFMRIASVAVEPSVLATSLLHFIAFGATVLAYEPRLRTRAWFVPVGLGLIVLILSTSTTGYFGMAVLGLLLSIMRPLEAIAAGVPAVAAAGAALVAIPRFRDAFISMTVGKGETSSYLERTAGGAKDFVTFVSHPVLGSGWGSASNFNAISTLLSNVGLVGTMVFLMASASTLWELSANSVGLAAGPHWRLRAYAAGVRNALIVSAACAISSGMKYVFPDDWIFWGFGIALASRMATLRSDAGRDPQAVVPLVTSLGLSGRGA